MKRFVLIAVMLVLMALPSWAANTVEMGEGFIHVTLDGATDFVWTTDTVTTGLNVGKYLKNLFPQGLLLTAVGYNGAAAGAKGVIRDKTTTGTIIPQKFNTIDGGPQVHYFTGRIYYKPCLVNADQTTPTATEWWFEYAN